MFTFWLTGRSVATSVASPKLIAPENWSVLYPYHESESDVARVKLTPPSVTMHSVSPCPAKE